MKTKVDILRMAYILPRMKSKLSSTWQAEFRGLFFGEGYIGVTKNGKGRRGTGPEYTARLQITLRDDDAEVIYDIQKKLGGTIHRERRGRLAISANGNPTQIKPYIVWRTRSFNDVRRIIHILEGGELPSRKREQLKIMHRFLRTQSLLGNGRELSAKYAAIKRRVGQIRESCWEKLIELHSYKHTVGGIIT